MKIKILILFLLYTPSLYSQSYAPAAGLPGTTAMHSDSSAFIDWAISAEIFRSYKNIAFPENGFVSYGDDTCVLKKADGNPGVLSLGDGGYAVLKFHFPVINGEGADFAVFENGFLESYNSNLAFLEFAFVDVSTDGIDYIRFPAISEIPYDEQKETFQNTDTRLVHNLAGKYTALYGTPFDLEDLKEACKGTSVNINNINFIKITDVIGNINTDFASHDSKGNIINDPYPTEFPSGGFDLDAIGIINNTISNISNSSYNILLYPNPAQAEINFYLKDANPTSIEIYDVSGEIIYVSQYSKNLININEFKRGIYFLKIYTDKNCFVSKFIKN